MTSQVTSQVTSATATDVLRRWRFWAGAAVVAVVAAIIGFIATGTSGQGVPLSPENPAPAGSRALAEVLRQQGVDVLQPARLDEAVADAPGATLLLHDPNGILDDGALARLASAGAARLILLDPTDSALTALAPDVMPSGSTTAAATADCADPAVQGAETVSGDSRIYRVDGDAIGCWSDGDGGYRMALVDGGRITVVGTTGAFGDEQIVLAGNAAFALRLLGQRDRLVWYQPTIADADTEAPPTIGSLSPPWVIPFAILLIAVFVAAAIWRGRRFGPLVVVEPLPAVVRADETMRGRARLYARAGARLRAIDAIRIGAIRRLARACGLPSSASVAEVVAAVAGATGRTPSSLRILLVDGLPGNDRDLVRLANELDALERELRRRLGTGE